MMPTKIVSRTKSSRPQSRFLVESKIFLSKILLSAGRLNQNVITIQCVDLNYNLKQMVVHFTAMFGSGLEVERELNAVGARIAERIHNRFRSMKRLKVSFQRME